MNRTVLFHLENATSLLDATTASTVTDLDLDEIRIHTTAAIEQLKQREKTK